MNSSPPPCDDLRIVDLTQGYSGPLATMVLADQGADVIKVEPPVGDWARSRLRGFHMWNRGKRSITLDLPAERDVLAGLLRWAQVVVTDSPGPTAARLGIDHDRLIADNPSLVHCHIGVWPSSPAGRAMDTGAPVYEGTLSAAIGRMIGLDRLSGQIIDPSRDDPTFCLPPVASYGAGLLAAQSILAAMLGRDGGDPGEYIETSLLQGAMTFLMRQELARPVPPLPPRGSDLLQRGIELCFLTAECSDGRYIQMCARQDHHFRSWLDALGILPVLDEPRYKTAPLGIPTSDDLEELEALLRSRMLTKSQAEWMAIFTSSRDIGADPFLTPEEFLAHPQMTANGRVVKVDDPTIGPSIQLGSLVEIEGWSPDAFAPAPTLDQHGEHIRRVEARSTAVPSATTPTRGGATRLPLEGVTILEVAYFVAGPLATTLLADLGARIIKVEPLEGDPYRRTGLQASKFLHGKESIALDLKHPEGRAVLQDLIRISDAMVHSFRAGVPERLGMDEATARGLQPNIVYLNAASYGSKGPESGRVAFHSTPTALSGAGIAQAGAGNAPVDDSFPDPASGIGAATALLIGLYDQRRHGRGKALETTMLTSAGYVMSNDLVMVDGDAHAQVADGEQLGIGSLYQLYPCRDGWVFVAAASPRERSRLAAALDLPVDGLDDMLGPHFATRSAPQVTATLSEADVSCTVVDLDGVELWLERHGFLQPADHPAFAPYYRTPAKISFAERPPAEKPACAVGEHTRGLLAEIGRTESDIARFVDEGVVGAGPA